MSTFFRIFWASLITIRLKLTFYDFTLLSVSVAIVYGVSL